MTAGLEIHVRVEDTTKAVEKAANKAAFRNFGHAAASIRKDIMRTLLVAKGASAPGTPPHTHTGIAHARRDVFGELGRRANRNAMLKRSIRYDADKTGLVVGPVRSEIAEIGNLHEFGGSYKGGDYPARPFMLPALERAIPRFAGEWTGSVGN